MADLADLSNAVIAVQDPGTSAGDLATIAQCHPTLRQLVAQHPNAYPALIDWIDAMSKGGEPMDPGSHPEHNPPIRAGRKAKKLWISLVCVLVAIAAAVSAYVFWYQPKNGGAIDQTKDDGAIVLGGSSADQFRKVVVTPNGQVIAAGMTGSSDGDFTNSGVRQDWPGGVVSSISLGGSVNWTVYCPGTVMGIALTMDGEIVAVGSGDNSNTGAITKINSSGEVMWSERYDGRIDFYAVTIDQDGSIIVAGDTYASDGPFSVKGIFGSNNAFLAKLNPDGDLAWVKVFGGSEGYAGFWSVALMSDGSIVAIGSVTTSDGDFAQMNGDSERESAGLVRVASNGDVIWVKAFGYMRPLGIAVDQNDNIVAVGHSLSTDGDFPVDSENGDAVLAKFSPEGTLIWSKALGGSQRDNAFAAVTIGKDGSIVAVGGQAKPNSGMQQQQDALIASFDAEGNLKWSKTCGGKGEDQFGSVAVDSKGNLIAVGSTDSTTGNFIAKAGSSDAIIVPFDPDGNFIQK